MANNKKKTFINEKDFQMRDVNSGFLQSGIFVNKVLFIDTIFHAINPWRVFTECGFSTMHTLIAQDEVLNFSESKHNLIRESLTNHPGVGPLTSRSVSESRVISLNNPQHTVVQDATNTRDRFVVALTPLIWIPANFYAADLQARAKFTQLAVQSTQVPTIFCETFKRTRSSTNGIFRFVPRLLVTGFSQLVFANPSLKDSFWDPDFLRSETGMNYYISFLARLATYEGNYIPYSAATPASLPVPESGNFTSFLSYTIEHTSRSLISPILCATNNSLPMDSSVMIADAAVLGAVYYDNGNALFIRHEGTSTKYATNSSFRAYASHIVRRVTGLDTNPYNGDPSPRQTPARPSAPTAGRKGEQPQSKEEKGSDLLGFNSSTNAIKDIIRDVVKELFKNDSDFKQKFAFASS